MKSIFDTPISCYRNVKDNVGTVTTLRDFLFCDQYMERIKNIRTLADEARQNSLKNRVATGNDFRYICSDAQGGEPCDPL